MAQGTPDELKSELRGDAVHIELDATETNGRVVAALAPLRRGARRRRRARGGCCTRAPTTAPAPCRSCCRPSRPQGVPVASVTVARPSLDDVYLKYTGRRFEQADAAAEVTR